MAHIMTTKQLSRYLKLHEITICKHAAAGAIPAIRIGRMWRFDKDVIDGLVAEGQNLPGRLDPQHPGWPRDRESAVRQSQSSGKK